MNFARTRGKTIMRRILLTLVIMMVALTVNPVFANHQLTLGDAITHYKAADYDRAIELLTVIVNDEAADIQYRKDALHYLGRCYIAKRLEGKAKEAIHELLTLEPPMVEFDPDRESPPLMKVYYEARKDISNGSYQVERPNPGIKTMAVIDFQNNSISDREKYQPMEQGFADIIINRLNGATDLKVVERERLQWILNELEIQNKYNMEGAVRAGKQMGVHTVLLGSYILNKKELWISARLVKVETSEILLTAEVKGKVDKFFDLSAELSEKVAQAIDTEIDYAANETQDKSDSNSLEAMLAYSEGLKLVEEGNYEAAYTRFTAAVEHDPSYDRARLKAESIRTLVTGYAAR